MHMSQTPAEFLGIIEAAFPFPTEEYAAAYRHQEMIYLFTAAADLLRTRHQKILDIIESEHLVSDIYAVHTPAIPVRSVNAAALRQSLPAVYDALVKIRASDAERFIGRQKLYELSCTAVGADRVRTAEFITLGDLERALPTHERDAYITVTYKPGAAVVVHRPEDIV